MKTIKFHTLGCKVNQYDTQSIREQFLKAGFRELENTHPADVYIINTCTVTQAADTASLNLIRRVKKENPQARIVVTGCLTELDEDKLKERDGLSLVIKNKDKGRIFELLNKLNELNQIKGISYFKGHTRAFLKIQDGCDNFCSYCKVPLVRGSPRSKPWEEIICEAKKLAENGFKEIVLSGICLGAYGKDLKAKINLAEVLNGLEEIPGLLRIRLSSIEANALSDELIEKISYSEKICRHLHLPIQSGDDEILKKMNRKYCRKGYSLLIKKIKKSIPQIAITTDVLVGFPGEQEANFRNTLSLIEEMMPLGAHIFPYSARQGTAAYKFKDNLSPGEIKKRVEKLKAIVLKCSLNYRKNFLGKKMEVLVESFSKEKGSLWLGHTDNYLKVLFKSKRNLKNQIVPVKLTKIYPGHMLGEF